TTPNVSWGGKGFFLQGGAAIDPGPVGFGSGVKLDGVNDYVAGSSYAVLSGNVNALSVGMWVRRDSTGRHAFARDTDDDFRLEYINDEVRLRVGSTTVSSGITLPADGVWTHLAVSFDTGTVRFYIDGVQYSRRTTSTTAIPFGASPTWVFGKGPNGSFVYLEGGLDDIIMETAAWSPARVLALSRSNRESCDGGDSNCDGTLDEGFATGAGACDGADADLCVSGTATVCHPGGFAVVCTGDGPTRAYRMEGLTGRLMLPTSGSSEPLYVMNGSTVAGHHDQALALGGAGRAVFASDSIGGSYSLQGTHAVWVRFDLAGEMTIFSKANDSGAPALFVGRNNGVLSITTGGTTTEYGSAVLTTGVWHHVAITINGSQLTPYLNGEAQAVHTHSGTIEATSNMSPFALGAVEASSGWQLRLTGALDEFVQDTAGLDQNAIANLVTLGDSCNTVDDDCDGTTDEGFEDLGNACGGGATCVTGGIFECSVTQTELECAGAPGTPGDTCDDGDICTHSDQCDAGGGCVGTAYGCDDGLPCTDDVCNGDGTCTFAPKPGFCAAGGVCYVDGEGHAANPCVLCDVANTQSALTDRPDNTVCDDASVCTPSDSCQLGVCTGPVVICDDGDDCTIDACDATTGCGVGSVLSGGETCDDSNGCTENTVCSSGGSCAGGDALDCDDGNACTADSCNVAIGCVNTVVPHTEACYAGPGGTAGVGLCKLGTRTCSGSVLGPCVGQIVPEAEKCDHLDNDCNGAVDEIFPTKGDECDGSDLDSCANGNLTCLADGSALECSGDVAQAEICDGKDNDCNGLTDENFPTLGNVCDSPDDLDSCADGIVGCEGGAAVCLSDGPVISLTGTNADRYVATDVSSTGNDAQRFGYPTNPGTGPFVFDGVDDRMAIPASPTVALSETFSVVLHVRRQASTGAVSLFESHTGACVDLAIRINASGAPFAIVEQSSCGLTSLPGGIALNVGTWAHLALVADGSNYRFYVNGVLKNTQVQAGPLFESSDFHIGALGSGLTAYKGEMGEIALYRKALDATEIAALSVQFSAPGGAQVEVCDAADNNCNGLVDEHASTEICDGKDNDCNNTIDDGYAGLNDSCDDLDGD
ncbi:MAG: hypothetical protein ACI9OJ_005654, partial [Myxococcota bacterium]